jgi:transcriptional regulator with XRE-family HTH domain
MYGLPYIVNESEMDDQLTGPALAEKIRRARLGLKESQGEFGKRFGAKQRSTVKGWEQGTPPNAEHLIKLNQFFKEQEEAQGEIHLHQWPLPFDHPIDFTFRISPHSAGIVRFAVEIKRRAS